MSLPFEVHLDAIAEELERFELAARSHLDAAVPSCPAWTVRDLSVHLLGVFDRWTAQVIAASPESRTEVERRSPADPEELFGALEAQSTELIAALSAAGPEAPSWSFFEEGRYVGWVARRIALELAVHRVDAELASGQANPIEAELAVEGIDERIEFFLRGRIGTSPERSLGGSLCLVCDDIEAAWVVDVERGRVRWRRGRGPADAAVVGSASDLYLFTWDRVAVEDLSVTGAKGVATAWHGLFV